MSFRRSTAVALLLFSACRSAVDPTSERLPSVEWTHPDRTVYLGTRPFPGSSRLNTGSVHPHAIAEILSPAITAMPSTAASGSSSPNDRRSTR
jgi:hypothetical protein